MKNVKVIKVVISLSPRTCLQDICGRDNREKTRENPSHANSSKRKYSCQIFSEWFVRHT